MKVVALISGGKDSCFNMMQCVAAGHEIVALANLYPVEKGIETNTCKIIIAKECYTNRTLISYNLFICIILIFVTYVLYLFNF